VDAKDRVIGHSALNTSERPIMGNGPFGVASVGP
jgi:hypothetical protein